MTMANETPNEKKLNKFINPDPFCPVRLTQIKISNHDSDKFAVELQNPAGEWQFLPGVGAVHGPNYALVSNEEAHNLALTAMDKMNLQFVPYRIVSSEKPFVWDGGKYIERWYSKEVAFKTPTGSTMYLGFEVQNSYDGTLPFGFSFFAMHHTCQNQFVSYNLFGKPMVCHHTKTFIDEVQAYLDQLAISTDLNIKINKSFNALANARIADFNDFLHIRNMLEDKTGYEFRDKQILDELSSRKVTSSFQLNVGDSYGNNDSFWALANAITAVSTHKVGGLRGEVMAGRAIDALIEEAGRRQ